MIDIDHWFGVHPGRFSNINYESNLNWEWSAIYCYMGQFLFLYISALDVRGPRMAIFPWKFKDPQKSR